MISQFKIKYRKTSDSTYTEVDITPSGTNYSYNNTYLISGISDDYEYNFELALTDYFGTVVSDKNIPTAFTLMDFNSSGKSIAFGQVSTVASTDKKMQVALATETTGDLTVSGNITNVSSSYYNGRRVQHIPDGTGSSYGWYLVATGAISLTYDNRAITMNVTESFSGASGILYANIRRNGTSFSVADFRISSFGCGLTLSNFCMVLNSSTYTYSLYAKTSAGAQLYMFEVISESSLDSVLKTQFLRLTIQQIQTQ